jgi:hypothetical protein
MTSTSTRDLVSQPYKYGFVTEIETDKIAKGLSEEVVRLISAKKRGAGFPAAVPAQGVSPLAHPRRARLGCSGLSRDRLPRHRLLRGAQAAGQEGQP